MVLRSLLAAVGLSLVTAASAQVDPLAPLPQSAVRAPAPQPARPLPPTYQPSFVQPAATGSGAAFTGMTRCGGSSSIR